jgi:hypothetical protein
MMNTDELIERLSREVPPVHPLWRPGWRAVAWLCAAAAYVVVLTVLLARSATPIELASPRVWLPHLVAIAAGLLASWASFASVIPGHSRLPAILAGIGTLIWIAAVVAASQWHSDIATIASARHELACVGVIVLGGLPLLLAMGAMLRRGAAFQPATTAAFAALAVGILTNIGACFWRPHAVDDVTLVWHGGAIIALVLVCAIGAQLVPTVIGARLSRRL